MDPILKELVEGLVAAYAKDEEPDAGGFDISAGMLGPNVSEWLRGVAQQLGGSVAQCAGDEATCLCDTHVWARHHAARAKLSRREHRAARGKLLGSDFAVAQPPRCYENSDGICVAPANVCCGNSASR